MIAPRNCRLNRCSLTMTVHWNGVHGIPLEGGLNGVKSRIEMVTNVMVVS